MKKKEVEKILERVFDAKNIQTLMRRETKKNPESSIEERFQVVAGEICKDEYFIKSYQLLYKFVIDMQSYVKFKVEINEYISDIYILYDIDEDGIITVPNTL